MNNPTIKEAEKFCLEIHKKMPKTMELFGIAHAKAMILAIKDLVQEKKIKVNLEKLEIAVWLHDIGYLINEENHAEESLKMAEEKFQIDNIIKDCILNHGSDMKPTTTEGKIMQLADKLSFFYKDFKDTIINNDIERGLSKQEAITRLKEKLSKLKTKFNDREYLKITARLD